MRIVYGGGEEIHLMPDKLLELKNDIVFQELFGKQKNSKITGHLISLILEKEIYNLDLDVNKRMLGNRKDSKIGRLDLRARFNNGEDCNIELQVAPYEYMPKRMLTYWTGVYQNKISRGQDYEVLKPTISILIADYKLEKLKDITEYHTKWNLREKNYPDIILTNDIEFHILEIPKIKENEILEDELAVWLKFIENPENKEVEKMMPENRFLKQAREELAYLSGDPDFQDLVESRAWFLLDQHSFNAQARREGLAAGRKEGIKEGRRENQIEIAKKLLKLEMPIDKIAEITELKKEEIQSLKDNN